MFDAYTVKKVMPKLLIALVLIQLSWFLFTGMITLNNAVAHGVMDLIYAPVRDTAGGVPDLSNAVSLVNGGTASAGASMFGGLVIGGGAWAFGVANIGVLLSLAGTVVLALAIGFFVLILRQVVLLGLLVISPVALVAWILPGTEKWWKLWWESFSKLLIMYPMILGMIAAGRVFGMIAAGSGGQAPGIVKLLIVILGFFGPFFLIPKTFQMAGSAFGSLAGMVNDKNKGAFDRLKNFRGRKAKEGFANAQAGNRFKRGGADGLRGRLNRGIAGAAMIPKEGISRTRLRTGLNTNAESHIEDFSKSKEAKAIFGDDAKIEAARYTSSEDIAASLVEFDQERFRGDENRRRREDTVAQIQRAQKATGGQTFQRARIRAQAKSGTGYQNQRTGRFEAWRMLEDINEAYGDDRAGAGDALAEMKSSLTNSGQMSGQAGYGTWASQLDASYRAQGQDEATRDQVRRNTHANIVQDAISNVTPGHALYGKPASARTLAEGHRLRIQELTRSVTTGSTHDFGDVPGGGVRQATMDDVAAATAAAAGIHEAMSHSASPANASAFAEELMGADMGLPPMSMPNPTGGPPIELSGGGTVRDYIGMQMAGNPAWVNRRKDLSESTLAAAERERAAGGLPPPGGGLGGVPGAGGPPATGSGR